jgi:uncharacterized protein YhaN
MTDLQPGGSGAGSTVEDQWLDWISVHAVECVESDHERCAWDSTRADLEAARSEIRHLIEERDHALAVAKSEQQWTHAAWVEIEQLKERIGRQSVAELLDLIAARRDLQQSLADLAQARAELNLFRTAAKATHDWKNPIHRWLNRNCSLCAALDATSGTVD